MKKRIVGVMVMIIFTIVLQSITALAEGDPNIDHGGGGWGDGSDQNKWEMFDEGIRATVVDAITGAPVSASVDFTNAKLVIRKLPVNGTIRKMYRYCLRM
ncbi:MAG: hypothetical protein K5678_03800 [Acetatifactor sp.]|nr:hypothetical protein [Acetatifactor sp.]